MERNFQWTLEAAANRERGAALGKKALSAAACALVFIETSQAFGNLSGAEVRASSYAPDWEEKPELPDSLFGLPAVREPWTRERHDWSEVRYEIRFRADFRPKNGRDVLEVLSELGTSDPYWKLPGGWTGFRFARASVAAEVPKGRTAADCGMVSAWSVDDEALSDAENPWSGSYRWGIFRSGDEAAEGPAGRSAADFLKACRLPEMIGPTIKAAKSFGSPWKETLGRARAKRKKK